MKFDKDTLVKQRFWVALAIAMPLALGAIFFLITVVSAEIGRKRDELEKAKSGIKVESGAKNEKNIEVKTKEADKVVDQKDKAWQKAWLEQESLQPWPKDLEKEFFFRNGLFAVEIKVLPKTAELKTEEKNRFAGTITSSFSEDPKTLIAGDPARVMVRGEGKKPQTVMFWRSGETKVLDESGDELKRKEFEDLKKGDRVIIKYQQARYFDEPLTATERRLYTKRTSGPNSAYDSQIEEILKLVTPVNEKGEGACWLGNWQYKEGQMPPVGAKFFRYVPEWADQHDISSETWLAQEDLWIQRGMYTIVKIANEYVSKFQDVTGDDSNKPSATRKFRNPYWDLELTLAGDETVPLLNVKITNRLARRQKLDLKFKVQFSKDQPGEVITIGGVPLDPKIEDNLKKEGRKDTEVKTVKLSPGLPHDEILGVEQVLTWETSAVKRIEQLAFGTNFGAEMAFSHRTVVESLRSLKEEAKKEDPAAAQDPEGKLPGPGFGPGPGGRGGEGARGEGGPGGFGFGGLGQGMPAQDLTPNLLIKVRYQEVTDQFRRLPVAMVLVVDQDHIERVLTSFRNSPFRFKMTQLVINRYPFSLQPQVMQEGIEGEGAPGQPVNPFGGNPFAGNPFMPRGGGGPGSSSPAPGAGDLAGGLPGFGPGPGVPGPGEGGLGGLGGQAAPEDLDPNIELVIYGEITLYNRYPPREAPPAAPAPEQK